MKKLLLSTLLFLTTLISNAQLINPINVGVPAFSSGQWRKYGVMSLLPPNYTTTGFNFNADAALLFSYYGNPANMTVYYTNTTSESQTFRLSWYSTRYVAPYNAAQYLGMVETVWFSDVRRWQPQPTVNASFPTWNYNSIVTIVGPGNIHEFKWTTYGGQSGLASVQFRRLYDIVHGGNTGITITWDWKVIVPFGYQLQMSPTVVGPWVTIPSGTAYSGTKFYRASRTVTPI